MALNIRADLLFNDVLNHNTVQDKVREINYTKAYKTNGILPSTSTLINIYFYFCVGYYNMLKGRNKTDLITANRGSF
jgi:hypothetical protein